MTSKHAVNGKLIKIVSVAAASAIIGGSLSILSYASVKNSSDTAQTATSDNQSTTETVDKEISKDETVYVLANADGSVKKIIVSDWIKNSINASKITDNADLKDVKNVKGEQSYTMDSENARVWNADGKDIYCQGTIEKALPVDLSVSYQLDGKTISADKLAGKSGKVTIRFDYKNNQYENVTIYGKTEKIYVPFVMLTGMLLDNEKFTNVEVSNGKIINDGNHIAVVGFALPGMQENLDVSKDKLDIPDYVEITADVKDFALTTTMTLATNNVFNEIDTSKLDSVDGLKDQLGQLTSAMSQLLDGSSQLYSGLTTLLGKSGELVAGINKISEGANQVSAGTSSLNAGLKELVSNNDDLNGGAAKVYNNLLATVQSQITANGIAIDNLTIDNYKTVLNNLLKNPTDTQKAQLISIATVALNQKLAAANVPEPYYDAVKVMLADRLGKGMTQEAAMAEISPILTNAAVVNEVAHNDQVTYDPTFVGQLMAQGQDQQTAALLSKLCNYITSKNGKTASENLETAEAMAIDANAIQSAMADSNKALKINGLCLSLATATLKPTIEGALTQLASYDEFYQGVLKYTKGAKDAYEGSSKLASGAEELKNGIVQLQSGSGQLIEGIRQLTDGSKKLADGLKQFNEQGVSKLTDIAGGDLGKVVSRLKATIDVSKNYTSFSGNADGQNGNVKFIYKTDEIK